ncbi:hypothetical protein V2J09_000143 [Rumex salicifolius]
MAEFATHAITKLNPKRITTLQITWLQKFLPHPNLLFFLCLNLLVFALTSAHGGGAGEGGKCTSCTPAHKKPPHETPTIGKCLVDALKLGVYANLLQHLLRIKIGEPPVTPCCSLIKDIVDLEAALCLCTAIKTSLLGIKLVALCPLACS